MLTKLQKRIFSVLIFIFIVSCINKSDNPKESNKYTDTDILLNRALLKGYYHQISQDMGVCLSGNKIYFLTDKKNESKNEIFLLHFVNEDYTFINKDFKGNKHLIEDSLLHKFEKLSVIQAPLIRGKHKNIRFGQYNRLEDGSTQNIWQKQISVNMTEADKFFYKNEFENLINKNILNESFELSLRFGAFFKNAQGFYILYDDDFIYIITKELNVLEDKFMLHFIDEKNNFVNKSFFLKDQQFQNHLEEPYSFLSITRISLPNEPFVKIRIGQFDSTGNKWTQEFKPDEIINNPLLKYVNEFQN